MPEGRLKLCPNGPMISALRRDLVLTQRELAAEAGIARATLARLEAGVQDGMSARTHRALVRALKLKPAQSDLILRYTKDPDYAAGSVESDKLSHAKQVMIEQAMDDLDDF